MLIVLKKSKASLQIIDQGLFIAQLSGGNNSLIVTKEVAERLANGGLKHWIEVGFVEIKEEELAKSEPVVKIGRSKK